MIKYDDVKFSYIKDEYVIDNFNYTVNRGSSVGVLGHNGAGKTTLLRLTSKLFKPMSGSIFMDEKLSIAYMPYNDALYPELSVYQNIAFRSECYLQSVNEFKYKVEYLLEKFNISDIRNKKISQLSSGLKKRVSLISTCITDADLILLDEPTNGIDPETLIIMSEFINELRAEGSTIIVNSHNLDFISKISDEIIILAHGKLIYSNSLSNIGDELDDIYLKYCRGEEENEI